MSWTRERLKALTLDMLELAYRTNRELGPEGYRELRTEKDVVLEADIAVTRAVRDALKESGVPAVLLREESDVGKERLVDSPSLTVGIDDIDGTGNKRDGRGHLPYCTIMTVLEGTEPTYDDALLAGIVSHNSKHVYFATRNEGVLRDDVQVSTSGARTPRRKGLVLVDHLMGSIENQGLMEKLMGHYGKFWFKDIGCAGISFALVASGGADAYVNIGQKGHELGAGYLMVREAGGEVLGINGPIGGDSYDFEGKRPIVAAATPELAREIVGYLTPSS